MRGLGVITEILRLLMTYSEYVWQKHYSMYHWNRYSEL